MEVVVFCFVLWLATQKALEYTRAGAAKSRKAYMKRAAKNHPHMPKGKRAGHALRHDLGYAASQVRHGFPQARHGFAAGWHQGRQAHAQALAGREKAKAEHLETRARLIPDLREYRRRQKEALERIRTGGTPQEPGEGSEGSQGSEPGAEETREVPEPEDAYDPPEDAYDPEEDTPEDAPTYSWGPEDSPSQWPANGPEAAHSWARHMSTDGGKPQVVTEYPPGGGPGKTVARYVNGEEAGSGEGADEGEGSEGSPQDDPAGQQETPPGQPGKEDGNMSETTYQSVKSMMDTAETEAEQYAAEAEQSQTVTEEHAEQARQAKDSGTAAAEEMQSLEVDAETLSAMADHLEALDAAEKLAAELNEQVTQLKEAWQRVQETAGQVKSQLDSSGHGALDEAHANAAAGGGKKEFYGEGG
jgi:chemotaxis protein histidine kinase CheA